ncbi:hypothetical protein [Pseudomonas sp. Q1-7]|uniref:hypothetical protein n=1 Tax=Pseudomonas sp. Q1-7 TaxID=3020843 RepID=UPI00230171DE|nr:hypothetical protein [Pseudomonas sp. Q1-7]
MTVRKEGGSWTADFYENGNAGRRVCKQGFATRAAARRYQADVIALRALTGQPLYQRLSELVLLWYRGHGQPSGLSIGERDVGDSFVPLSLLTGG